MRRLTAQGLLRQAPAGGSVVADFCRRDVAELYELREALEVYAAGKAAERGLRPVELGALTGLVKEVMQLCNSSKASGEQRLGADAMAGFIQNDLFGRLNALVPCAHVLSLEARLTLSSMNTTTVSTPVLSKSYQLVA